MKARIKKKIFKNMYKLNYNINQILFATRGLFLTPIWMKNGYKYYASYYFGKITKSIKIKKVYDSKRKK